MDDGGRCVLINDSQLLQSIFGNSNSTTVNATAKKDAQVAFVNMQKMETTTAKKEVKAKKSTVLATKSSPASNLVATVDLNGKANNVNTLPIGQLQQGQMQQQPLTLVPNSMGLMSLTGSLPVNAQSMHQQHQTLTLTNSSTAMNSANSSTIRASTPIMPQTQFQLGPRPMTVQLPQQLLMPGMQMGQPGLSQFVLTSRNPNPSSSMQPGQVLQFIQTSQGTQILKSNPPTSIQQIASTATTTTNSKSAGNNSRSNKQILPKPQSSSSTSASTPSKSTNMQSNNTKLIQQQTNTFNTQTFNANSGFGTPQFVLGSGQQHANIITGPQGTFLLNNNFGSQPFFIQGNGLQNPVQLAIRPQAPLFVNNNSLAGDTSNLSISLANNAQLSNNKPVVQTNQQQTFLFNANSSQAGASSNLIMAPNLRHGTPNIFIRPQFQQPPQQQFLQIQTANGPLLVALPPQSQLPQQQTILQQPTAQANVHPQTIQVGNTFYQLAANPPSLNLQSGGHPLQTILTHPQQDASTISNQSAIMQSNIATSMSISNNSIVFSNSNNNNNTNQPSAILPKNQSNMQVANQQSPKTNSSKGLNLADLLKETGILSDFSPPTSPKNSLPSINTDISQVQVAPTVLANDAPQVLPTVGNQPVLMVQGGAINAHQNVLIAPNNSSINTQPLTSQLRVTIGPDGTLMLVSPGANAAQPGQFALATLAGKGQLKDTSGIGSSQPSPDSTTPSIDTSTSSPSTSLSQSVSSLISLPTSTVDQKPIQMFSSNENMRIGSDSKQGTATVLLDNQLLSKRTEVPSSLKGTRSTICDINNKAAASTNSDTLHLAPSNANLTSQKGTSEGMRLAPGMPVPLTLAPLGMVTLADVTGVPILQVSSANAEFMSRLETQIKALSSQTSYTQAQLDLIKELSNIQDTILRPTNSLGLAMQLNLSNNAQQLLQLTNIKNNNMQILFNQNQNQNSIQVAANVSNLILPQSATSGEFVKLSTTNCAATFNSSVTFQVASTATGQPFVKVLNLNFLNNFKFTLIICFCRPTQFN